MARTLNDIVIRDAIILMAFIGLVVVLIAMTGCSANDGGACAAPSDCEGLEPSAGCTGEWSCSEGKCVFDCPAEEPGMTGDNETDEIGSQLQRIEETMYELDMAYIEQLEKEIGSLTW